MGRGLCRQAWKPVMNSSIGGKLKPVRPRLRALAGRRAVWLSCLWRTIILGPAGDRVPGVLTNKGMTAGAYKSADGPRELEARASKPFMMAGGSGGPVLHKQSGAVIGVLLTADDGKQARVVGFKTLCLPKPK